MTEDEQGGKSLEAALAEIDEKYNLGTCEDAQELGRSVAHLRD